jgi:gamma-glutamylcyclotransferase
VTLYFAYGSNLCEALLKSRCPSAQRVGIARIDGHRIGFTRMSARQGGGVADLMPEAGSQVWGALFDLAESDLDSLDEYEGVPTAYCRKLRTVERPDETLAAAWVYTVTSKGLAETTPSLRYWRLIVQGAKEALLPPEYIAFLESLPHLPSLE